MSLVLISHCNSLCRDNVEWDEEQEEAAQKAIEKQKLAPISPEEQGEFLHEPFLE